jgi:hypothetical protein
MGKSYYVPRSAKGESRILVIFTVKSLITTIAFGGIGVAIAFLVKEILNLSIIPMIILIVPFAAIGYGIGSLKIPDLPIMGPLQKAGGEELLDILFRLVSFPSKKKIYIYGKDRIIEKKTTNKNINIPIKSSNIRGGK